MILHPALLALEISALLCATMVVYAACFGMGIVRYWNLASGSETQLVLERQTYLVSTVLSYFLAFQLVSLFLFIRTADSICHLFVGAMCAVGTLTVNAFGYPTLALKLVNFLLAGLWLILNHADSRGYDYPLIRVKYLLLALVAPFFALEAGLQTLFFLNLDPDIITSCCGALFSPASRNLATEVVNAPPLPMLGILYGSGVLLLLAGGAFLRRGIGGYLFGGANLVHLAVALAAVVSVVSPYLYELPSHHCPFCILDPEYYFFGYPLYLSLLIAAVTGMGVGLLQPFRKVASLAETLPALQRRLVRISLGAQAVFLILCTLPVLFSALSLR
ncbi:hypothetical protein [Geomesophilobacter sediminis]|uniref:Uncharacterized protein n=1 Tax=Geomesophilobacter sediminis TaxID=2798584 RepID=A0A8J7M0B9_9BACT|nr:hypothetical protein [Geomesophilobacter sediminis]MBJ6724377.1 hypothetical protein [Geomesophilobacter sediminis]